MSARKASGPAKAYRGSKKRLRRIRMRGNSSLAFWMFVAAVLFSMCVALPWIIRHLPSEPPVQGNAMRAR
jgi:hypothetical protein